ncbi:MAG: FG-GAP repeat domain-containing protein, partial [Candidatus Rokuibacteriota bacterium]
MQGIVRSLHPLLPLAMSLALLLVPPAPAASGEEHAATFRVLADQVAGLFPAVDTQVVDVVEGRVTLASGRAQGVLPGLELTAVREGRELYHPATKKLLGRAEVTLGRLVVVESFEQYAVASASPQVLARLQPGDQARVSAGKLPLALVVLGTGRSRTVEAATAELVQELERTGRFQVRFADEVGVWLTRERIKPEDFLRGQGIRPVAERFKLGHVLALHFTTQQGKPFMDVRLFSSALDIPALQHALFVPPSIKPSPGRQFSTGQGVQPQKVERRSLLARLLSGDFEPNRYSAGAASIPIKSLATFPFLVRSMDMAVAPGDRTPRMVVTDGQRVFLYRLKEQTLEPEWTHDKLMAGQILSVQLADLDADGVLDVVVNRQEVKVGMLSYILTTKNGGPALLAGDIPLMLLAVDEVGDGVNRALWGQRYDPEKFWTLGTATRYNLKADRADVVASEHVIVHSSFRPTGATFSNIAGAERVLA